MKEQIHAVHSKEVRDLFIHLNLLEDLEEKKIQCYCCENIISLENFRAIVRFENKYIFACDKENCVSKLATISRKF